MFSRRKSPDAKTHPEITCNQLPFYFFRARKKRVPECRLLIKRYHLARDEMMIHINTIFDTVQVNLA